MKFKFKPQDYQIDATNAIVDCFRGQEKVDMKSVELYQRTGYLDNIDVISNPLLQLNADELKLNISNIQNKNYIPSSDFKNLKNFSVEMETGTGKTYTYINTMYKLYKNYGFSKFIIVVPSVAIREGVYKSLEITEEHFQEIYGEKIRYYIYNSTNPQNIIDFTENSGIQCMVMNFQAFNRRGENALRIYKERDEFGSNAPIDLIKAVKPIVIIDEPQKISDKTEETLEENFNPLFYLRYSATHKKGKEYNKVYSLNAIDAFNKKLVKKIEVIGLELTNDKSDGTYFYVKEITADKKTPIAILEFEKHKSGKLVKVIRKFRVGDDLYTYSNGLEPYKGYVISEINAHPDELWIEFTNGVRLNLNDMSGKLDTYHLFRGQIKETIETHLRKERILFNEGIKVLSLFFVDKVINYRDYDKEDAKGLIANLFEELYEEAIQNYIDDKDFYSYINKFDTDCIHKGYFSVDKNNKFIDSKEKKSGKELLGSDDVSAYDLILKNKEALLDLEEPTRFIFSHSALREGWDNPNVFQICTLKESKSEINKRQEIGRGLRICVNQFGERMDYSRLEEEFHDYNTLTVIANESYNSFSDGLQKEMSDSLSDKKLIFNVTKLLDKKVSNDDGIPLTLSISVLEKLDSIFKQSGYLDYGTNEVTDHFKNDMDKKKIKLPAEFEIFSKEIIQLLNDEIFDSKYYIENASAKNIKPHDFILNKNFYKESFQNLWKKINIKSNYEVNFETDLLVERSIKAINKIKLGRLRITTTKGEQQNIISAKTLNEGKSFTDYKVYEEKIDEASHTTIKYDLVGEIQKNTQLMRKTIIRVLTNIEERAFNEYKNDPDSFITEVSKILNDEKASCIIEGIKYYKSSQIYENKIFIDNKFSGQLEKDVLKVNNHVYDYVKVDSTIEKNFTKKLDKNDDVVYAKLPTGFKIKTPVGNYNPDWAIVLENKKMKEIYFIAETKGTTALNELRTVEQAKIKCASEHFKAISDDEVKFDVVDSYEKLMDIIG